MPALIKFGIYPCVFPLCFFKPENLLYENKSEDAELKIADFGLSKMLYGDENTATVCGTPGYCGKLNYRAFF